MGTLSTKNSCCPCDKKQSFMEISFVNSFVRDSEYESPIPDEVCEYQSSMRMASEPTAEESTDGDKYMDVCSEPMKNRLEISRIFHGSKNRTNK